MRVVLVAIKVTAGFVFVDENDQQQPDGRISEQSYHSLQAFEEQAALALREAWAHLKDEQNALAQPLAAETETIVQ